MTYKVGDTVYWKTYVDKFGFTEESGVGKVVEVDPDDDRLTYLVQVAGTTESRWLVSAYLKGKEK